MGAHFIKEAKLVVEFRIYVGIGFIPTRGDVKIMESDLLVQSRAFAQHDRNMPAVDFTAKVLHVDSLERHAREYGELRDNLSVR